MQNTIGLGLATALLLGCSGGVLDLGSSDGGEGAPASLPDVSVFTAAAVANAYRICLDARASPSGPDSRWTNYAPPSALQADLVGGWLICYFRSPQDARSFQFTADGRWYTLTDDGDGGLKRGVLTGSELPTPGYDGGVIGYEGTYTFQDGNGRPSSPDGSAVYVATHGLTWFHPEFTGQLMSMNWVTDGSEDTCVRLVGP